MFANIKAKQKKYFSSTDETGRKNIGKPLILLVEFLGTFALVLWIILPSALGFSDPSSKTYAIEFWEVWAKIWDSFIMKAFWVAGFIYILIILLRRVSVNLNPAVTTAEIIVGNDSVGLGISKIGVQFLGAFGASFFAYWLALMEGQWAIDMAADPVILNGVEYTVAGDLDAVMPKITIWDWGNVDPNSTKQVYWMFDKQWFWFIQFMLETLFTLLLLASIFWGKNISKNKRALIISITVWILVTFGIRTHNISLNPARLIAPAVVSSIMGQTVAASYIWYFLLGQLFAIGLFAYLKNQKDLKT